MSGYPFRPVTNHPATTGSSPSRRLEPTATPDSLVCNGVVMGASEIDYDGEIAREYDEGRRLSPHAVATWRAAVESLLPESAPIVDVGAGTGRFADLLAGIAGVPVFAVEPASGMRRPPARPEAESPRWLAGTAEALPLRDDSCGMVWTAFTTHYFDLAEAAREFRRVLRPDGRVLIWHAFPDVFDELEWFRWFPTARAIDETRMPSAATVQTAFERAGLRFVARTDVRMLITDSLRALADRMAHRSISTLRLIDDDEFERGLAALRSHAESGSDDRPVYAPNVLLEFVVA